MHSEIHPVQFQAARLPRRLRRSRRTEGKVAVVATVIPRLLVEVDEFGMRYGLDAVAIRDLRTLFGPRGTKQELLANARRPSRIR
jgi:hypothetical protein